MIETYRNKTELKSFRKIEGLQSSLKISVQLATNKTLKTD